MNKENVILNIHITMLDNGGDNVDIKINSTPSIKDSVMVEILSKMLAKYAENANE